MSTEDIDKALAKARDAIGNAEEISESTEIVRASGVDIASARKSEMVERRASMLRQKIIAETAQQEARALIQKEKDRLQQMMWELEKEMTPLQEKLSRMGDGIDALNIYLGRDEEIELLRDGERAPADDTIFVRQMVLAMDEESLIAADEDGIDFKDIDLFAEWLVADQTHVDQIIPERKGVVAIIPRRAEKRYENVWEDDAAQKWNRQTYWVIRNGECIWLTTTEFTVGNRTVPTPKEFTDLFLRRGFGGEVTHIEPGTREWEKAEKESDRRTRHYMKVALLLEGLIDRTTVFHPMTTNVSFLDQSSYDSERIRVILDGENVLTSGRPSFSQWQREKVSHLREGMRVVGAFGSRMRTYSSKNYGSADVRPEGSVPDNNVPYIIRSYDGDWSGRKWAFSFERGLIWDRDTFEQRESKTKATGYLTGDEPWVLPLDLITEEEINYYLNSRAERHQYLDMIPTLRAVLAVKKAEREHEAPFRQALIGMLAKEGNISIEEASDLSDDLIFWYKTANKWQRSLDRDNEQAARAIIREARRRWKGDASEIVLDTLRAQYPEALVIARRTNDLVVITRRGRRHPNVPENIFVDIHSHGLRGGHKSTEEWAVLRRASVNRWTVLYESDEWENQVFDAKRGENLTDDEIDWVIEFALSKYPTLVQLRIDGLSAGAYVHAEAGVSILTYHRLSLDVLGKAVHASIRLSRDKGGLRASTEGVSGSERDLSSNYWGEHHADKTVWRNEEREKAIAATKNAEEEERRAARRVTDKVIHLLSQIEEAWKAAELDRIHERFIEDFGDESLWENHLKTVKFPSYPGDSIYDARQYGAWHYRPKTLTGALRELVEKDEDVSGMTVREVVEKVGADVSLVAPEIVDLRFPKEEK